MGVKYEDAPDVLKVVKELLRTIPDHRLLVDGGAKFGCLYRDSVNPWMQRGKQVFAKTTKADPKAKHMTGFDFLIVVDKWGWERMKPDTRRALIDHELMHCSCELTGAGEPRLIKANGKEYFKWTTIGHDLEEFTAVVRRHGIWTDDLKRFVRRTRDVVFQTNLFDENAETDSVPMSEPKLKVVNGGKG